MRRYAITVGLGIAAAMALAAGSASAANWTAYVLDSLDSQPGTVTPIDLATGQPGSTITVGEGPEAAAMTPNGQTLYVANASDSTVIPISVATNTAGTPIPVGSSPESVAVTPNGDTVWVGDTGDKKIWPIAVDGNKVGTPITMSQAVTAVAISPNGSTLYALTTPNIGDGEVTPIDLATGAKGTAIPVGADPYAIGLTPNGSEAYVANYNSASVTPIDLVHDTAATPISTTAMYPASVAISPDGTTAYVPSGEGVMPISTATNKAGPSITTPGAGYEMAIAPDGRTGYATDFETGQLMPLSLPNGPASSTPISSGSDATAVVITPDQAPTARFSATAAAPGSPSTFNGSASTSPVGAIASYAWSFGDGTTATTTTPVVSHKYASAGTYTATLTVTNTAGTSTTQVFTGQTVLRNGGPQARATESITIASPPPPAPKLTHLKQSHRKWKERSGTTFSFTLNERARAMLAFTQRVGHKTKIRGTVTVTGQAGANKVPFKGRLSKHKRLKPGRYTVVVTASVNGKSSQPAKLTFTIKG